MKSVGSKQNFSVYMDNLTTCRSSCRRRRTTSTMPFNLSVSNRRKKPETDGEDPEPCKFKARKIPKTHKVPFIVYHSTKNLTSFNNVGVAPKSSFIGDTSKIVAKTPYEELCNPRPEPKNINRIQKPKSYSVGTTNAKLAAFCKTYETSRNCANESSKQSGCSDYVVQSNAVNSDHKESRLSSFALSNSKRYATNEPKQYQPLTEENKITDSIVDSWKMHSLDQQILELDSEQSLTMDNQCNENERISAMFLESFSKTQSQLDNSFDSKDTVSLSGFG